MTNKKITLRESELRGMLETEHARGYKEGYSVAWAARADEVKTLRARWNVLQAVVTGCKALAELGEGVI